MASVQRLGPIQNTHSFFDEEGKEIHRCVLVFDNEQEMIRFNLPQDDDNSEDDCNCSQCEDAGEYSHKFNEADETTSYTFESEEETEQTYTPSWSPIYMPRINFRFLMRHPKSLLQFFRFIDEYNNSLENYADKAVETNSQPFTIPKIPSYIVEHILQHPHHCYPTHGHRAFLNYSPEDEKELCDRVKELEDTSSEFIPSGLTWDIQYEGYGPDFWDPVYMPHMDERFIIYHPRVLVAFFVFIGAYDVFHHPMYRYDIKPIPSSVINTIKEHTDIKTNNLSAFKEARDINFLLGWLEQCSIDNHDDGSQYDNFEKDFPEQYAYDKEMGIY
jgi:hypothetical protein